MQITIRGHNMKVSDNVEDYGTKKLEKLERYLPNIRDMYLELSQQDNKRGEDYTIAQLTVQHERGAILRTEERVGGFGRDSQEAAINQAIDKMHRRISRFKGKRRDSRRKRGRYSATSEELELAEEFLDEEEYADEAETSNAVEPEIVRRKNVVVIPMTEMEAIEQMELLGHTFFLFYNQTTSSVNVMYKRADGDYGVLVPENAF